MNIAIVGYGSQGRSALEYWNNGQNSLTVCDKIPDLELPQGISGQLGAGYLQDLDRFDLIVRSPSVHPRDLETVPFDKITSNTNEFFKACPTKNIIGVTGTKGKGTTSTLIAKMLEACGKTVHLGGNIGTPPLEILKNGIKAEDWVVLELANFQLIDLKYSPHIAVCLMIEPEHQDWHKSLDEYYAAKAQLFNLQTNKDYAIFNAKNTQSKAIASKSNGILIGYLSPEGATIENGAVQIDGQQIIAVDEIRLKGSHNLENVCAAVTAVWQISKDSKILHEVLAAFEGLPFRIERRKTTDGVTYYNDSFSSAPGATIAAIKTVEGRKVLIIGGKDRGLPLGELAKTVRDHEGEIIKTVLIGASADRAASAFEAAGLNNYVKSQASTMEEIVKDAKSYAEANSAVILSPGFPSFDMFRNFEDRGIQFNEAVDKL